MDIKQIKLSYTYEYVTPSSKSH